MRHALLSCLIGLLTLLTLSAAHAGGRTAMPVTVTSVPGVQAMAPADVARADTMVSCGQLRQLAVTDLTQVTNDDRTEQYCEPEDTRPAMAALQPPPHSPPMAPLEAWPQALLRPPRSAHA